MMMISIPAFAGAPAAPSPIADRDPKPAASDGTAIVGGGPGDTFATALDRAGRERSTASTVRTARPTAGRTRRDAVATDNRTTARRRSTVTEPPAAGLATPPVELATKVDESTPTGTSPTGPGVKVAAVALAASDDGATTATTTAAAGPAEAATANDSTTPAVDTADAAPTSAGQPSTALRPTVPTPAVEPGSGSSDDAATSDTRAAAAPPAQATRVARATPANQSDATTRINRGAAAMLATPELQAAPRLRSTVAGDAPTTSPGESVTAADPATNATIASGSADAPTSTNPAAPVTTAKPTIPGSAAAAATVTTPPASATAAIAATAAAPAESAPSTPAPARPADRVTATVRTRPGDGTTTAPAVAPGPTAGDGATGGAADGQTADEGRDRARHLGAVDAASSDVSGEPVATAATQPAAGASTVSVDATSVAATGQVASTHLASATTPNHEVSSTASVDSASADRLLDQVVGQIRLHGANGVPGLESRFHDPQLGSLRLVIVGRAGETVRAELIAADPATADALVRAADRAVSGSLGLAGIDLRIRSEAGSFQANAGTNGRSDDRPAGFAGNDNGTAGTSQQAGRDDPGSDRNSTASAGQARQTSRLAPVATRPTTSNARTRSAGLDVRA
jgi:hypothetical protein